MILRDLKDYELQYKDDSHYSFEKIQVEYRRKNILSQITQNKHSSILEVGSGVDPFFSHFSDFKEYTIVEPSSVFYSLASRVRDGDPRITLVNQYFENTNLQNKFDFIIISSLLHELRKPMAVLNTAIKLCHSDSTIYINVPNAKSFHRILALESGLIESIYSKSENQKRFQQNHTYDINTLEELCNDCGLKVHDKGSYFLKPFTHSQMRDILNHNIINKTVLDGLDKIISHMPEFGSEIFVSCKTF